MKGAYRNLVASYLGNGWAALLGVVVMPIYIRLLGIEAIGLIGFLATLQAWLLMMDLGLPSTLNRELARSGAGQDSQEEVGNLLRTLEVIALLVALFICMLIAVFSFRIASEWLLTENLALETTSNALSLMGASIALQWLSALYRGALFGLQQHVWVGVVTGGLATVRVVGTLVVLVYVSRTVTGYVLVLVGISLLEALLLAWRVRSSIPTRSRTGKFTMLAIKPIWRFAAAMAVIGFLGTMMTQIDKILLSTLLPLDQYGYFTLAVTVAGAFSMLVVPIYNIAYPRLSMLVARNENKKLSTEYHNFSVLLSVVVLPLALMLSLFSSEIIYLWTGDIKISGAVAPIISVLVIGTGLNGLLHIPYAAQLANGWPKLTMTANAAAVICMIPALLFLVPKYGAVAAAWIWVAVNSMFLLILIPLMHRRILKQERVKWYRWAIIYPIISGGGVAVAIYGLHHYIYPEGRLGQTVFLVSATAIIAFVILRATPPGRKFLRNACLSVRKSVQKT